MAIFMYEISCKKQHISLINGIGRKRTELLGKYGITKWSDLENVNNNTLIKYGFDELECKAIRGALQILSKNLAMLKENLSNEALDNMIPCAMELEKDKDGGYEVKEIGYKDKEGIHLSKINKENKDEVIKEFITKVKNNRLVFYGIDYVAFKKLYLDMPVKEKIKIMEMFKIFDRLLHNPFMGLDLYTVTAFIEKRYGGNYNEKSA